MPINENAPLNVVPGAIRFNTDSMKLEYYRGGPVGFGTTTTTGEWVNLTTDSPDIQTGGARGVFGGGYVTPLYRNTIDYINISTTGNAISFGSLSAVRYVPGACADRTRGLFAGGESGPSPVAFNSTIYKITISSTGDTSSFGSLTGNRGYLASVASSTRGLFAGGNVPTLTNTIEYVTIQADATAVSFGNLTQARGDFSTSASSTRGIFAGGSTAPTAVNTIDFITFSSTGNAADFGDLTQARRSSFGSASNSVRGLFAGGSSTPTPATTLYNTIDYITLATLGNANDFGDLSVVAYYGTATSSSTRGVFALGLTTPLNTYINTIEYVTIMSIGNSVDFGDLSVNRVGTGALSNGHGGLG